MSFRQDFGFGFLHWSILLNGSFNYPVGESGDCSADTRVVRVSTAVAPRGDPDQNVPVVQRTPSVPLAGVATPHAQDPGADHVRSDDEVRVTSLKVALAAEVIVDCVDNDVPKHRRRGFDIRLKSNNAYRIQFHPHH